MLHRRTSKDMANSSMTPGPSYMSKDQVVDYLGELRANRPSRPSGSRPLPSAKKPSLNVTTTPTERIASTGSHAPSLDFRGTVSRSDSRASEVPHTSTDTAGHPRSESRLGRVRDTSPYAGRPIVQQPARPPTEAPPETTQNVGVLGSATYRESGSRWMERQEANSLRRALEDMDLRGDAELHAAAQDEASELVWRHQNPGVPQRNPDEPYKYREHLRRGSHARSHSDMRTSVAAPQEGQRDSNVHDVQDMHRTGQLDPTETSRSSSRSPRTSISPPAFNEMDTFDDRRRDTHELWDSPHKKAYVNLAYAKPSQAAPGRRRSSGSRSRVISGGSGRSLFKNPDDQIYEEPEEDQPSLQQAQTERPSMPAPLQVKPRNSQAKVHFARDWPPRTNTAPVTATLGKLQEQEIHKNPPSQSRNAGYVVNALPPTPPDSASDSDRVATLEADKDSVEIRGEDIRAATSMRMKDRSPKLPNPSIVSDKPGRPIVSFDENWRPREKELKQERSFDSSTLASNDASNGDEASPNVRVHAESPREPVSKGPIPVFNIFEPQRESSSVTVPEINISHVPSISVEAPSNQNAGNVTATKDLQSSRRPLPKPKQAAARPQPHHSATAPASTAGPTGRRPMASCTQCQLPIAGRIVSAAGERFHPECFVCYNCGEGLECVAFYPEPDVKHAERVARIRQRAADCELEEIEGKTAYDDGEDESLRYYCHLDFHEFFSPRCKSCKTPIEGEIVVACGAEWHIGHFFCAECGDPFDPSTPFVEKDGYAWCVNCHTNRYSTKCKKCRRPVTDMVVKALDAEWHSECFCCMECGGPFEDGRYFVRDASTDPVCVKCEERRLKA